MIEVDRLMVEVYGIGLVRMMENAGRALAGLALVLLGGAVEGRAVAVACGSGNNGGGGLVAARHLSNWGARVVVLATAPRARLKPVPAEQIAILEHLPVQIETLGRRDWAAPLAASDLIVDALIGYSLSGPPRADVAAVIRAINEAARPVLSLDLPSGLEPDSGEVSDPTVRATATMALALPKRGLLQPGARAVAGDLYVADIGVPPQLYSRIGLEIGLLFAGEELIPID